MKLNDSIEYLAILAMTIYIVFYASNLTNNYPLKLVELCNEKFIIISILGIIYYLVHCKKYTLVILFLIVILFLYLNIPLLSEPFLDKANITEPFLDDIADEMNKEQLKLYNDIENMDAEKMMGVFEDTFKLDAIEGSLTKSQEMLNDLSEELKNKKP